jgi:hypothetical protein
MYSTNRRCKLKNKTRSLREDNLDWSADAATLVQLHVTHSHVFDGQAVGRTLGFLIGLLIGLAHRAVPPSICPPLEPMSSRSVFVKAQNEIMFSLSNTDFRCFPTEYFRIHSTQHWHAAEPLTQQLEITDTRKALDFFEGLRKRNL